MTARQVRERQYRRLVATGLGVSIAVHGAILGLSTFSVDGPAADDETRAQAERVEDFEVPAIELVAFSKPSVAATESTTAPAQAPQRIAVEPKPSAASPRAQIEMQLALSMQHDFTTQREVSDWALQPIRFAGNQDGGDDAEEDDHGHGHDSGGRSWWEGLGIAIGIGGGGHCPVGVGGPGPYISN
ncbi:MAG: hypothetical protein ACR2QM_19475 [Longimicrobiales bacterium]